MSKTYTLLNLKPSPTLLVTPPNSSIFPYNMSRKIRVISIATFTLLGILSAFFIFRLQFSFDFEQFFPTGDPDLEFFREFTENFETDDNFLLVAVRREEGAFDQAFLQDFHDFSIATRKIPHVVESQAITQISYPLKTPFGFTSIPAIHIDHKSFSSREEYDANMAECIDEFAPDLIVLAGFMRILTPSFVEHYQGKMLNIHPSLLPKYKGLDTHQRAISAGDTEHGASVHFVTPELDGGPIVLQSKVPVFEQQDPQELAERVQQQERQMYPLVIKWFCEDRLKMFDNKATLDSEILTEEGYAIG